MISLLGLGDNTVDTYVDAGMQYPGGNAVNVAVMACRLGAKAAYLGCLGSDAGGRLVHDALREEGVDVSHVRFRAGANARALISQEGGDRRFLRSRPGVRGEYEFEESDFAFIAAHDVVHTSVNSDLVGLLPQIRAAAAILSFDFSERWSDPVLERALPFVDLAFLSCPGLGDEECKDLLHACLGHGVRLAVVTRGALGAMAAQHDQVYRRNAVPAEVIDTLGAGDGFIAALLVALVSRQSLADALEAGARYAARVCGWRGAFGHGVAWDGEGVAPACTAIIGAKGRI